VLRYTWDFVDDNGQDLRTSTFQYHPDPACNLRMAAARETFHLSGSLKVFHQTDAMGAPLIDFSLCYVTPYIDSRFCPPVTSTYPCGP